MSRLVPVPRGQEPPLPASGGRTRGGACAHPSPLSARFGLCPVSAHVVWSAREARQAGRCSRRNPGAEAGWSRIVRAMTLAIWHVPCLRGPPMARRGSPDEARIHQPRSGGADEPGKQRGQPRAVGHRSPRCGFGEGAPTSLGTIVPAWPVVRCGAREGRPPRQSHSISDVDPS